MSDTSQQRTALFVGASRGLGLGLVQRHLERGWHVIATARGTSEALQALSADAGGRLAIESLDINEPEQIEALAGRLSGRRLDLLFVVAGIAHEPGQTIGQISTQSFTELMLTNALSPMRVVERLQSLVPAGGTIAVMTSGLGSIANNQTGGYETYRATKAALNMLLSSAAVRHTPSGRAFLAVDPGWVRTDMGGPEANLDVETSTGGMADMLEARRGSTGVAFVTYANQELPW